jgi:ABC-2 type transport system ATP-binding protein
MRTKLALLLAVARRPALLILDEPSEGLDPLGVEQLLETLVTQCADGTTVFFSSHQIAEVERISDHVCVLDKGSLVLDESLDALRQSWRQIDLVFPATPDEAQFQIAGIERVKMQGQRMSVFANGNLEAIVERAKDLRANAIDVSPIGLREIFLLRVGEN